MEQISGILFICITLPLIPMLFILPDKQSRLCMGYVIIGETICLIVGALNIFLLQAFNNDNMYVTTTISPICEEVLKAIPVLYYAILFSAKREVLLSISFACGIGFAVLENAVILTKSFNNAEIGWAWALGRVVGAALMHGACTSLVGMGISYVHMRKKLFFCGTFALLVTAVLFHSTFNVFIQSHDYNVIGTLMPAALYIPVAGKEILRRRKSKAKADENK